MKHVRMITLVFLMFCTGLAFVTAAPVAEETHQKIRSLDLDSMTMEEILETYDSFYARVDRMATNAREEMAQARAERDSTAYEEAYDRYRNLSSYAMDELETERLLARILDEPEEERVAYAQWLHRNSRYYRPMLTIDFSQQGEGYHYSYSQRIRQVPGTDITLPDAENLFSHSSRLGMLEGWGTTSDSVDYRPGETIPMPLVDQTLHAIWTSAVQFSDAKSGLSVLHSPVEPGETVQIPTPEAPDDSYRFVGWFDRSTGRLLRDEEVYTVEKRGARFDAVWKHLSVEAIAPLYYGFDRIPTDRQVAIGFVLANRGSLPVRNITAQLTTDSPHVTLICDTLTVHDVPAGRYRTNNMRFASTMRPNISGESNTFRIVIDESTPTGTKIPFTLTVSDAEGTQWQTHVTFMVR